MTMKEFNVILTMGWHCPFKVTILTNVCCCFCCCCCCWRWCDRFSSTTTTREREREREREKDRKCRHVRTRLTIYDLNACSIESAPKVESSIGKVRLQRMLSLSLSLSLSLTLDSCDVSCQYQTRKTFLQSRGRRDNQR